MDSTLKEIVDQLIEKTENKGVIWNKSSSPNEFYVEFASGTIITRLYTVKNSLGLSFQYVECVIKNLRGDVVLRESTQANQESDNELYALYDIAFRSYTGKDEVLNDIISQLKSDVVIGQ